MDYIKPPGINTSYVIIGNSANIKQDCDDVLLEKGHLEYSYQDCLKHLPNTISNILNSRGSLASINASEVQSSAVVGTVYNR